MEDKGNTKSKFDVKYLLLGGCLTLFMVMIGVGIGFLFFFKTNFLNIIKDGNTSTPEVVIEDEEEDNVDNDNENENNNGSYVDYVGKYVKTIMPMDWSVVEYENGDGGHLVSGINYTGLTGLKVKNPSGTEYFQITALYGIGGTSECPEVYIFADTPQSYLDGIAQDQVDMGAPASQTINLAGTEYVEYSVLGKKVRRIEDKLYWNSYQADDDEFFPACGFSNYVQTFPDISFTIDNTETGKSYSGSIINNPTDTELIELDIILSNLESK